MKTMGLIVVIDPTYLEQAQMNPSTFHGAQAKIDKLRLPARTPLPQQVELRGIQQIQGQKQEDL